MKKIIITGKNSFVGSSLKSFLSLWTNEYLIDVIDTRNGEWLNKSFLNYDIVFHVAGIVHINENKNNAHLYYEINRDLTLTIAKKAKREHVKLFIFISSMSVYGLNTGIITKDTVPIPQNAYGDSKLQAENEIKKMESENFKICIIRPPMIYGKNCKGNFQDLVLLMKKLFFFPNINNRRSMIYIDNLSSFIKEVIDRGCYGIYHPQNDEYICTSDMAYLIATSLGRKVYFSRLLGLCVYIIKPFSLKLRKAFGSLIYEDLDSLDFDYCHIDFKQSIEKSL